MQFNVFQAEDLLADSDTVEGFLIYIVYNFVAH